MNPFITILGLSCSSQGPVKTESPQTAPIEKPDTMDKSENQEDLQNTVEQVTPANPNGIDPPPQPNSPIRTANPPPVNVPQPPPTPMNSLPRWDDVPPPEDLPQGTPTAGLALSHDTKLCYKEWFAERSVHPHVRRYGGRILGADETTTGTRILCSEAEKTAVLNRLREAGVIPTETP